MVTKGHGTAYLVQLGTACLLLGTWTSSDTLLNPFSSDLHLSQLSYMIEILQQLAGAFSAEGGSDQVFSHP